jgi:hypothetical protein
MSRLADFASLSFGTSIGDRVRIGAGLNPEGRLFVRSTISRRASGEKFGAEHVLSDELERNPAILFRSLSDLFARLAKEIR